MHIISISGVDGSGKSTQIQLLKKELASRGHRVMYFHAVTFGIVATMADFVQRLRKDQNSDKSKEHENEGGAREDDGASVIRASWSAIQLRKIALLIDILRFERLVRIWADAGYTHVVSDRYFYDSVINILYLSHNRKIHAFGISLIAQLITPPTHAFFLDLDPHIIMQRERTPEQGHAYLADKRTLFQKKQDQWNLQAIDGDTTPENIFHKIKEGLRT